ncbi:tRNA (adenosine(37)-N6)-threonylcarbamoyltransferase complex ATPase subunit type 1 TsaE [Siminovitchia sp. 179-K 8D1 HS]|uniref:tRNA (adenosine(37)-N6)-threonylcarbamoyltransferase complex ATPase subunit type 1 TsaE n=1 Tax=Siminovitchia sp. 179-K 8D1 HS TaxID=3142385 RepID=UPI0039A2C725
MGNHFEIVAALPEKTFAIGEKLGRLLEAGDVILLEGGLGAGKTTFTKGLAAGLGVRKTVNSPTFTIIKEYEGRLPLYHMDVYRLEDSFEDLGFDEYFDGDGVTVVEWARFIKEQLPQERLAVELHHLDGQNRKIVFKPCGSRYEALCKEFFHENPGN